CRRYLDGSAEWRKAQLDIDRCGHGKGIFHDLTMMGSKTGCKHLSIKILVVLERHLTGAWRVFDNSAKDDAGTLNGLAIRTCDNNGGVHCKSSAQKNESEKYAAHVNPPCTRR